MNPIEQGALSLLAEAIDRDDGKDAQEGFRFLRGKLGQSVAETLKEDPNQLPKCLSAEQENALGQSLFCRLEQATFQILCGDRAADLDYRTQLKLDESAVTKAVATTLRAGLGTSKETATIVTAMILHGMAEPSMTAACAEWRSRANTTTRKNAQRTQT